MCYGNILESGLRKARKQHFCTACRRPIRPGERYERVVAAEWDGEPGLTTQKLCGRCERASRLYNDEAGGDSCYPIEEPRRWLRDLLASGAETVASLRRKLR
jgi:hypothetical protein